MSVYFAADTLETQRAVWNIIAGDYDQAGRSVGVNIQRDGVGLERLL